MYRRRHTYKNNHITNSLLIIGIGLLTLALIPIECTVLIERPQTRILVPIESTRTRTRTHAD